MELVTCPNCNGGDSSRWPGGRCTICGGSGQTTPERAALVRANALKKDREQEREE